MLDGWTSIEMSRGRLERRQAEVYEKPVELLQGWQQVETVIKLTGIRQGKPYKREGYYISSFCATGQEFDQGIRTHWKVENGLHWTKDVVLKKDISRIRTGNAPENRSVMRNLVISVFHKAGYKSLTQAQRLVCNDIKKLLQLLE